MTNEIEITSDAETHEVTENEAIQNDEQAEIPENESSEQEDRRLTEAEWLKKERNVVSRRDKQIGKLRAQFEASQAELEKYRQSQQQAAQAPTNSDNGRPKDTDFKTYAEYVEAVQDWKIAKAREEWKRENERTQTSSQQAFTERQWHAQRDTELDRAGAEYAKAVPNFMALVEENASVIQAFPDSIKRVIKEVDSMDAVKAFHRMALDGTLEDLGEMTPVQAAAAIAKAASMPQRPSAITRAPTPMASARGTGSGSKTLTRMTPEELVQWVNS